MIVLIKGWFKIAFNGGREMNKKYFLIIFLLMFSAAVITEELKIVKKIEGLSFPESITYDRTSDYFFISNTGPDNGPMAKDNNGYITKISGDFSKRIDKWVAAGKGIILNAPKGLAVRDGILYVSDIDHLKGFEISSARQVLDEDLSGLGANFLNDVAADDSGNIYVSCTGTGMIFRYSITSKKTEIWLKKNIIIGTNGIGYLPETKAFIVVGYADGTIYRLDAAGKKIEKIKDGYISLDGIDYDSKGNLYFSSYTRGKIWRLDQKGNAEVIYEIDSSPADISIDRYHGYLLVPVMMSNMAVVIQLPM